MDAVTRFEGIATEYDAARPTPPREVTELLCQLSGVARPDVVDLGAGTGLSTMIWSGVAGSVTAVEPGMDMGSILAARIAGHPEFTVLTAPAERTGLPDGCADIVTASQAMHWFDPPRVIPEIARLLRPGGVFAAIDCDFPMTVSPEVDIASRDFDDRLMELQIERGVVPPRADKAGHLGRLADSGLFRHTKEVGLHMRDVGTAARVLTLANSMGGTGALLDLGVTEEELGLAALRETVTRELTRPTTFWWTYRIRLAVR